MAFLEEIPIYWKIWDWIVDCVIVVDICLTILTAVRDDNHRVIDDPRKIFMMYLKSWLLLDILCVFPFELVISPIEGKDIQSFWDIFKLTKVYRLIRVVRIIKMILKVVVPRIFHKPMICLCKRLIPSSQTLRLSSALKK